MVPSTVNILHLKIEQEGADPWTKEFFIKGQERKLDESLIVLPSLSDDAQLHIEANAFLGDEKRATASHAQSFVPGTLVEEYLPLDWLPGNCFDADNDSYGFGDACLGLDCDDDDAQSYPGAAELCDGRDNDCDGSIDEELLPPACELTLGVCRNSVADCGGAEGWLPCAASQYGLHHEIEELSCDGFDNDCDGFVDQIAEEHQPPCSLSLGVCASAHQSCHSGLDSSRWVDCADGDYGPFYEPGNEISCDGLDNDCDGESDEGVNCPSCTGNADCDDGNSCTDDTCVDHLCRFQRREAGSSCNDGQFCRTNDVCTENGVCRGTLTESPCTDVCRATCNELTDSCDPSPAGVSCADDGLYCNGTEACDGNGICASSGSPCPETDCKHCQESTDTCVDPAGTVCSSDDVFCNGDESCNAAGSCNQHSGDPCPETDCRHCNESDASCVDAPGTACTTDGVFCNGDESCDGAGLCNQHSGDPCPGTQCQTCQEASHTCFDPVNSSCDDGHNCRTEDYCNGTGACQPGPVHKDSDHDSHWDANCAGGDDCDDEDPTVPSAEGPRCDALKTCFDGKDNDCDNLIDDDDDDCAAASYLCLYGPESAEATVASGAALHVYIDTDTTHVPTTTIYPERIVCFSDASRQIPATEVFAMDLDNMEAWSKSNVVINPSNPGSARLAGNASLISPYIDTTQVSGQLALRARVQQHGLDSGEFSDLVYRPNPGASWLPLHRLDSGSGTKAFEISLALPTELIGLPQLQFALLQTASSSVEYSYLYHFEIFAPAPASQSVEIFRNGFETSEGNLTSGCAADVIKFVNEHIDADICLDWASAFSGSYGLSIAASDTELTQITTDKFYLGWAPVGSNLALSLMGQNNSTVTDDYNYIGFLANYSAGDVYVPMANLFAPMSAMQAFSFNAVWPGDLPPSKSIQFYISGPVLAQGGALMAVDDLAVTWTQASYDSVGAFTVDAQNPHLFSANFQSDKSGAATISCVYIDEAIDSSQHGYIGYWRSNGDVGAPVEAVNFQSSGDLDLTIVP